MLKKFGDLYIDLSKVVAAQHFHDEEDDIFTEHLDLWLGDSGNIKISVDTKENIKALLVELTEALKETA